MQNISYWNKERVTLFAVSELRRLLDQQQVETKLGFQMKTDEQTPTIHLLRAAEYTHYFGKETNLKTDGFTIETNEDVWIVGHEARAILYGVYTYCQKKYGYRYTELGQETTCFSQKENLPTSYTEIPRLKRRGNVLETINDPSYVEAIIDFGVKNGQNEFFFTFFLWDALRPYLIHAVKDREVDVTLGGHSLSYLIEEVRKEGRGAALTEKEKLGFFSGNEALQQLIIEKMIAICKRDQVIKRISLWPEDIGIDQKDADDFLQTYIHFTEKLQAALKEAGLSVLVEHIVYNAGLSWDMLERKDASVSREVDVLYAYWGRDYSQSIDCQRADQQRAKQALEDWTKEVHRAGKQLTVFEYYSDHFMLTELFPPLIERVDQDVDDYAALGVDGMVNLIVPLHEKGIHPMIDENYPWRWVHLLNNFVFARVVWGMSYEAAVEAYFSMFEQDAAAYREKIALLEKTISQHTKWNRPLFPARIVDPEKVTNLQKEASPLSYLQAVKERLDTIDVSYVEPLIAIQNNRNHAAFSVREMTDIYLYYVKQIVSLQEKAWRDI